MFKRKTQVATLRRYQVWCSTVAGSPMWSIEATHHKLSHDRSCVTLYRGDIEVGFFNRLLAWHVGAIEL